MGSPIWDSSPPQTLANRWFDQDLKLIAQPSPQQAIVGVLESIVFLAALNLDTMRDFGIGISKLRLTGGVAKSGAICQRLADLSGCAIIRPAESESTLLGIKRLLSNQTDQSGSKRPTEEDAGETFIPRSNPELEKRYQAFNSLIAML